MFSNPVCSDAFVCVPLRTLRQAGQLRVLRNSCAQYMTGNPRRIGALRQALWFLFFYRRQSLYRVTLYYSRDGHLAGYGGMLKDGNWIAITESVAESERRRGLGTRILSDMLKQAGSSPVFVDVFAENAASLQFHIRAGFVRVGSSVVCGETVETLVKLNLPY